MSGLRRAADTRDISHSNGEDAGPNVEDGEEAKDEAVGVAATEVVEEGRGGHLMVRGEVRGVEVERGDEGEEEIVSLQLLFKIWESTTHGIYAI